MASNLPFGSGRSDRFASKAHLPTSAPFRARAMARYPAGYAGRPAEGWTVVPVSRRLTAHRHWLPGHPVPARDLGLRHLRLTGQRLTALPDPDGVSTFRMREQRPGWAPPRPPRPAVLTRPTKICPAAACRSSTARPCTLVLIPSPRALGNEASAGVHSRSPVRPSPRLRSRMERARFGFSPELRTPQLPATHVRAGTGLEHWPGAIAPTSSALQSASSLTTCDLVSHVLSPVISDEPQLASSPALGPSRPAARGKTTSALMDTVLTTHHGRARHPISGLSSRPPAGARSHPRTQSPGCLGVLTRQRLPEPSLPHGAHVPLGLTR